MTVFTAQAQESKWRELAPEERAAHLTEWMKEKLELNDDLSKQVNQINLKYANQMELLKTDDGSRFSKFQKIKSIDESKDQELKKLLSADKFAKYLDEKEAIREKIKNYREG